MSTLPTRHLQRDFFIADIVDVMPKNDLGSMEHPLFALRSGIRTIRRYEWKGTTVTIEPGIHGQATIHDKDIWIYCLSQAVEALNRDRSDISKRIRFIAYDFLVSTNRTTSGLGYQRLTEALRRLSTTRIETNIKSAGYQERSSFGLIESWRIVKRDAQNRLVSVEVELPEWLWRAIETKQVLTLSRDYFRLRSPLERRLYELARKHCGNKAHWRISIPSLYFKSGSTSSIKRFRQNLKQLIAHDNLPDYRISLDSKRDMVIFYARAVKGSQLQLQHLINPTRGFTSI